jgi:ATP-dependent DNA helicase DinG
MREYVFGKTDRIILTSATLTANKKFDFIKERIGFDPPEEMILEGPFDYAKQTLLYLPEDLPGPDEETEKYISAMARRIRELIHASDGKTFVLFTSYEMLNHVYRILKPLLPEYPLLKQGELPPSRMIKEFKETPSVIFGTSSFWQGVDVPGEALSNVIITKLPFDVPSEPLIEARIEDLRKRSINPFRHFQIPRAIIQLRQGFGRLIRKKTDKGIVAILDTRIVKRNYGKYFIDSLPDCPVVSELEEVKLFFSNNKKLKKSIDVKG